MGEYYEIYRDALYNLCGNPHSYTRSKIVMKLRMRGAWPVLFLLTIIVSIIEMVVPCKVEGYQLLPILPLTYGVMVTLSGAGNAFVSIETPGLSIVNILYFIKSVLYTLLQQLSGATNTAFITTTSRENVIATILNIIEVIVIYSVMAYYISRRENRSGITRLADVDTSSIGNKRNVFLFVFFGFVIFLIIRTPSVLYKYNFFTVSSLDLIRENAKNSDTGNITSVLVDLAKSILPVMVCKWAYKKHIETGKTIYIGYALILLSLLTMVVTGVSRTSFVVTGVSSCFLLMRLFPEKRSIISRVYLIVLIIVFTSFSMMRFSNFLGMRGNSAGARIDSISNTLQAYFCGIQNMGAAIRTKETFSTEIGINTFLSDLLGNWMGIGTLFRGTTNITQYFNETIHAHVLSYDQIIPTIGQSYVQFGLIGTYIYTIIMCIIIGKCDNKIGKSESIEFYYLYLLMTVKCAVTLMGNMRIFMASMLNTFIPLFVIFYFNRRIVGKKN